MLEVVGEVELGRMPGGREGKRPEGATAAAVAAAAGELLEDELEVAVAAAISWACSACKACRLGPPLAAEVIDSSGKLPTPSWAHSFCMCSALNI